MAQRGLCSRREADTYIERGWVRVNGTVVSELGSRAAPDAKITLERQAARNQTNKVTIILNKPVGYVSHQSEKGYRTAASLIQARRSEEHTSELQSLMRISYAVFCLRKKEHTRLSKACD